MARQVRFTATDPIKIEPGTYDTTRTIFVCACGVSQKYPFCDGSHKTCRLENPGTLYVYDAERRTIVEERPDSPPPAPPPSL